MVFEVDVDLQALNGAAAILDYVFPQTFDLKDGSRQINVPVCGDRDAFLGDSA